MSTKKFSVLECREALEVAFQQIYMKEHKPECYFESKRYRGSPNQGWLMVKTPDGHIGCWSLGISGTPREMSKLDPEDFPLLIQAPFHDRMGMLRREALKILLAR